jgi:hypothetical protein
LHVCMHTSMYTCMRALRSASSRFLFSSAIVLFKWLYVCMHTIMYTCMRAFRSAFSRFVFVPKPPYCSCNCTYIHVIVYLRLVMHVCIMHTVYWLYSCICTLCTGCNQVYAHAIMYMHVNIVPICNMDTSLFCIHIYIYSVYKYTCRYRGTQTRTCMYASFMHQDVI